MVGRRNWGNVVGRCTERRAASLFFSLAVLRALGPHTPTFLSFFSHPHYHAAHRLHRVATHIDGATRKGCDVDPHTTFQYVALDMCA
jgi:hypothetical protein